MKRRKHEIDGGPFNLNESNSSLALVNWRQEHRAACNEGDTAAYHRPKYDPLSHEYDMSGTKRLYIFNHDTWDSKIATGFRNLPSPRPGTEHDVKRLQDTFSINKKFLVNIPFHNLTHAQIHEEISGICALDHKNTSCIAIAVLTHGNSAGEVYAADKPYWPREIIDRLQLERQLAGVPKLFFIQACRGTKIDTGHRLQIDGSPPMKAVAIATYSDNLVLRSTYPDHVALRDIHTGSWLIQSLCDVLDKHPNENICDIMLLVNHEMSLRNLAANNTVDHKFQIPEVRFTLTKSFKL